MYNEYSYPVWGQVIGWVMSLSSIMCIPGVMIFKIVTTEGTFQEVIIPHLASMALEHNTCPKQMHVLGKTDLLYFIGLNAII